MHLTLTHPTASALPSTLRKVQGLARESVPALADFVLVHLLTGSVIACVAGAHATRDGARLVRAMRRLHQVDRDDPDSTVAHVVRTRRFMLRTGIQPDTLPRRGRRGGDEIEELHRQLAPRSALVVLIDRDGPPAHGRRPSRLGEASAILGALTLCYSHSGRSYTPADIPAATRAAHRIARALMPGLTHGSPGVRTTARHPGQGTTVRRRVAARN